MAWLVNVQGVGKGWHKPLFQGLDLLVHQGDRLGIIGPNGSGKSTVLQILAGRLAQDEGTRLQAVGATIGWVAQEDQFAPGQSVRAVLMAAAQAGGWNASECAKRCAAWLLQGDFAHPEQEAAQLSGGWRKRLALCAALLSEPDLLCLDEPTNHLDLAGVLWLEELLISGKQTVVLVSHDRWFLERVATRVLAIDPRFPSGFFAAQGSYGAFLAAQAAQLVNQQAQEARLANRWEREAAWLLKRPKARTTKSAARIQDAAALAADLAAVRGRNKAGGKAGISFTASGRQANELIVAEDLGKGFGERRCFMNLHTIISAGERIGIIGRNGSGKTTLLRVLGGTLAPDSGRLKHAHELKVVTFSQNRSELDRSITLRKALAPNGDTVHFAARSMHVQAWAKRFLFTAQQLGESVGALSGGEQARVLLAQLMCREADVLLLDEPTNDLDIPTLEVLEDALREFPGAVLMISHDRYVMEAVCDRFLALDGQGGVAQVASYDQWEEQLRQAEHEAAQARNAAASRAQAQAQAQARPSAESASTTAAPQSAGLNAKEHGELKRLESKIAELEAHLSEISERLAQDAQLWADPAALAKVQGRHEKLQQEVSQALSRWEQLAQRL